MTLCRFQDVGVQDYLRSFGLQKELVEARKRDLVPDSLFQVEHPPVVTLGKFHGNRHLRVPVAFLRERGIAYVQSDRGGDITYHGPGQLVLYPILKLEGNERGVADYLRRLEEMAIRVLARLGLRGERAPGMTGVWVGGRKIMAIGVRISRWVTCHGIAFNVNTNLEHFSWIVPCGLEGKEVTSLERELRRPVRIPDIAPLFREAFEEVFGRTLVRDRPFEVEETEEERTWQEKRPNRLPPWLKMKLPAGGKFLAVDEAVHSRRLHTVCESARCPNLGECWSDHRTATFMILGNRCTRFCRFCSVPSGRPDPWESDEPERVAEAAAELGLDYVVVTSVDRDDLPDLGAEAFARTIRAIRARRPGTKVEVLTPDFRGNVDCVRTVLDARPDVFAHNVETVPSLYRTVRPGSQYAWSLEVLRAARALGGPSVRVKSSLMAGLGESRDELLAVFAHLRDLGVDIVTLGQYLRPTRKHHPVVRFLSPSEFREWKRRGEAMGIPWVESGPLVRSSYHASVQESALEPAGAGRTRDSFDV
jgi:lipoic acid synthetase